MFEFSANKVSYKFENKKWLLNTGLDLKHLYTFFRPNTGSQFCEGYVFSSQTTRVAGPKFGHPALSSKLYGNALNTEFVAEVGMFRKIKSQLEF